MSRIDPHWEDLEVVRRFAARNPDHRLKEVALGILPLPGEPHTFACGESE